MRNPLHHRLPRELRSDIGKYLVIFLLMALSIGLVSGYLVAAESMIKAYNDSFTKYHIENGNFLLSEKASRDQIRRMEEEKITLYENFYREVNLDNGSVMRIFKDRTQVNLACLMKGRMPEKPGEIAIDRMYADNNHLKVGDKISSINMEWTVTGLVALSDYSALFRDNNDTMFDSIRFGVGVVTEEEFSSYQAKTLRYNYSWIYDNPPKEEAEEKEISDDLMEAINDVVRLEAFTPRYLNQAIIFTGDDMTSDRAMMQIFLYIIIVIIAFVFRITIRTTIQQEAKEIGTLRASGYTKSELIRHYMTMPLLVTLVSALTGNILGYTFLKDFCASLYYGSYSLPTYVTIWNGSAFFQTTVIPIILMILITWVSLRRSLSLPPLQFLRRDLTRRHQKKTLYLSHHIPFLTRFRLRVIIQNMSNYMMLFIGILFANFLLIFGLTLPSVLEHYQKEIEKNLLCKYQYILQIPMSAMNEDQKLKSFLNLMTFYYEVETDDEDAEKFTAYSLNTLRKGSKKSEEITLYGIKQDSKYIPLDVSGEQVYITSAYAQKYRLKAGDRITLKEKYEDKRYHFTIYGIYPYEGSLSLFMEQKYMNRIFDLDEDYFSGYFSNRKLTDIKKKYISTIIDLDSLTKVSRQLMVSMGGMMNLVDAFSIIMYMIIIYLMSKIIIERNANPISMAKILGYDNREISGLYIAPTAIVVVIFLLLSFPIERALLDIIFRVYIMSTISGWIPFYMDPMIYVKMFLLGFITYMIVALLEYRKIRNVPMEEALKDVT